MKEVTYRPLPSRPLVPMRALVTGASGFIGSHLTRRLVAKGVEVHVMVRPSTDPWRLDDVWYRVHVHRGDLRSYEDVHRIVRAVRPDTIFHLGSYVNVKRSLDEVDEIDAVIIRGTMNLVRAVLSEVPEALFINTGTCEEYGDGPVPFHEDQLPQPVSPYSAAKTAATFFVLMASKTLGLRGVTVRPFLTYGPAQQPLRLIPQAILAGLLKREFRMTPGEQTREFNYVSDIVEGYLQVARHPDVAGHILNLGNGHEIQIREVVRLIFDLMGNPIEPQIGALPYRPGETWHFYSDPRKAQQLIEWHPVVSLEEGLRRTIAWYERHLDRVVARWKDVLP